MTQNIEWNTWLADADSVEPLAPEDYDHDENVARRSALRDGLSRGLHGYQVKTAPLDLYQDGTGLVHSGISPEGVDARQLRATLAWVVLSRFGRLATVEDCKDAALLGAIRKVLDGLGLRYIDHEHLLAGTYTGKCKAFVGSSLANRYFALVAEYSASAADEA
jgi:hypothetical protein